MKRPINERPLTATLQKSYYGKAVVITNGAEIALRSYNTIVASYNTATGEFKRLWSGWSVTTNKHINDFCILLHIPTFNKKEWVSLPVEKPQATFNVIVSNGFASHRGTAKLTAGECECYIDQLSDRDPYRYFYYD